MNLQRVNNFRMGAYAALAIGLINLRYQTGADGNIMKSLVLIGPGLLLLLLTFSKPGREWLQTKTAGSLAIALGGLLLAYSFFV